MIICLNLALIAMILSGLACLIVGVFYLSKGCKKDNIDKTKIGKGRKLTILGSIVLTSFVIAAIIIIRKEIESPDFLDGIWLLLFLFGMFYYAFVLILLTFFLALGIGSLQDGFARRKEGIYEVADIVLGFVILFLGLVVLATSIAFAVASWNELFDSIKNSMNSRNPSSRPEEISSSAYLFYLINK